MIYVFFSTAQRQQALILFHKSGSVESIVCVYTYLGSTTGESNRKPLDGQ